MGAKLADSKLQCEEEYSRKKNSLRHRGSSGLLAEYSVINSDWPMSLSTNHKLNKPFEKKKLPFFLTHSL